MNVSLGAVVANLGVVAVLVTAKMAAEDRARAAARAPSGAEHATFTTLVMSTGPTFGTISSLYVMVVR